MTGSGVDEHAAFESFRAAYAGAQAEGTTEDPSLNMLLGLVEPSFAAMIRNLSIPHWFDEELFIGVMRLRGMEGRSPSGYAEAFTCRKFSLAIR